MRGRKINPQSKEQIKKSETGIARLNIRIEAATLNRLQEIADKEGKGETNYFVRRAIKLWLKYYDKAKGEYLP